MNEHDALLAAYKAHVRAELEETRADGQPSSSATLPKGDKVDQLRWMEWEAATRDSVLLYDGEDVYEKHVDALTLTDAKEVAAFNYLVARAKMEAGEQHFFTADVLEGLEELEGDDA